MASTRASLTVGTDYLLPSLLAFSMYWKKMFQACCWPSLAVISGNFITEMALTSASTSFSSSSKASTTSFLMRSFSRQGAIETRDSTREYLTLQLFLLESTNLICLNIFSVTSSFLRDRATTGADSRALILMMSKVSLMKEFQISQKSPLIVFFSTTPAKAYRFSATALLRRGLASSKAKPLKIFLSSACLWSASWEQVEGIRKQAAILGAQAISFLLRLVIRGKQFCSKNCLSCPSASSLRQVTALSLTGGWSSEASTLRGQMRAAIYAAVLQFLLSSRMPSATLVRKSLSLSICSMISMRQGMSQSFTLA